MLSAMGGPFELAFEKFKPGVEIVLIVRQMPISQQEFAVRHEWVTLLMLRPLLPKRVSTVFATLFCEWTGLRDIVRIRGVLALSWVASNLLRSLSAKYDRKA
jgi:hypothetical protein